MKKKKLIRSAILGFIGMLCFPAALQSEGVGPTVICILLGLGLIFFAVKPWVLKKRIVEEPKQEPQYNEPDDKTEYPFSSAGMAAAKGAQDFIVFDTETTGFSPRDDKIIELTALKIKDGEVSRFHSLVNPQRRIPKKTISVHGITDAIVADAPPFRDIVKDLDAFLDPALPIVGHNVSFDLRFLWWAYHDEGMEIAPRKTIDTYKLSRKAFPDRSSWSLESLIHDYALIEGEQTHRTDDDVDATLGLLKLCREALQ